MHCFPALLGVQYGVKWGWGGVGCKIQKSRPGPTAVIQNSAVNIVQCHGLAVCTWCAAELCDPALLARQAVFKLMTKVPWQQGRAHPVQLAGRPRVLHCCWEQGEWVVYLGRVWGWWQDGQQHVVVSMLGLGKVSDVLGRSGDGDVAAVVMALGSPTLLRQAILSL